MRVARRLQISFLALAILALGSVQFANLFLIADRALPGSPVTWVAPHCFVWAQQFTQRIALRLPQLHEQQFLAAVALDIAQKNPAAQTFLFAQQSIAALPPSATRDADEAQLAFLQGDNKRALQYGIQAHAVHTVETTLDRVEQQGDLGLSERADQAWIRVLQGRATDSEALAAAWSRDGRLENRQAETVRNSSERLVHQNAALAAFRAAVALTPLSGVALLNAGYAAVVLHANDEAQRYFAAAVASDPASASGYVGLARVALMQQQMAQAKLSYQHAYRLAPQQPDVLQLGHDLSIQ